MTLWRRRGRRGEEREEKPLPPVEACKESWGALPRQGWEDDQGEEAWLKRHWCRWW